MADSHYDVLSFGNAIVDVIASVEEDFLLASGLPKGSMTLIDEEQAATLSSRISGSMESPGGSAANTAVGIASLGGRAAFVGKTKGDSYGRAFRNGLKAAGVGFHTSPSEEGPSTARCIVLVTPDGERTMATFLGACQKLTAFDVDRDLIEASSFVYLEGYLWDPPMAIDAFRLAARSAHESGRRVALSLSDAFCVDRHREDFLDLISKGSLDVLFANQHEIRSLFQTADFETAIAEVQKAGLLAAVTRSERGCVIVEGSMRIDVPAFPVPEVVDATGAGDLFAAGFLYGLASEPNDLQRAGRIGCLAASEAISHFGARPQSDLAALCRKWGLFS